MGCFAVAAVGNFNFTKTKIMEHFFRNIGLIIFILTFLMSGETAFGQQEKVRIRSGNEAYSGKDYERALRSYDEALTISPRNTTALHNKADALYRMGKYDEASEIFEQLAKSESNSGRKSEAFHNLGNSLLKTEKYKESIDAYRNALRLNPSDEQTRYNLAYALSKLKKQEEQNKSCDKPRDNKGEKDKEKQGNQENQSDPSKDNKGEKKDEKKEDSADSKKEGEPKDEKGEQNPEPRKEQAKPMSKEEAEMILNALEKSEKDIQKKMIKATQPAKRNPAEKDW